MLLLALGVIAAAPAQASDKQDFETCDGHIHPGKQADGMRAASTAPRFGSFTGGHNSSVEACTRALASPRLRPTQTLRRAHLLRARAVAHLQADNAVQALKDLDLAQAALGGAADEPFLKRSMGVSITLLRGLAMAKAGDLAGAVPLARAAAAARPYSLQVQQVAAHILQLARPDGDISPSPWALVARLDPDTASVALAKEAEIGNFAGVVAMRPAISADWPTEPLAPLALAARDPAALRLMSAMIVSLHTAYARAATGDVAGARRDLAEARAGVAATRPIANGGTEAMPVARTNAATLSTSLDRYVDTRARQIEARIAVAEKRPSDAIATLVAAPMPHDSATLDLLRSLKAAMPTEHAGLVPDLALFHKGSTNDRLASLTATIPAALIAPETPRAVIDYARARPNILGALVGAAVSMGTSLLGGISRTDGFRSTDNPDGTIKVEFIGNTPSAAVVQEMTLLRAAEVARAAGKPRFVITGRKEYVRALVRTQYGAQISSTPNGFKTELTIRPVDAGAEPVRAFDATAIIDALGPLYYEETAKSA